VATLKVRKITKALCGLSFSKNQGSDICKKMNSEIKAWLNPQMKEDYAYVFLDARYNKV